jgi:hypothetical protein
MRQLLALFALGLGLVVWQPAHAFEGVVTGTYDVHGVNPNGTAYSGTVVIKPVAEKYTFNWLISSGQPFNGTGTREADTITVDWGQKFPVIYVVGSDGVLRGKWDNGRGSETLVRKQ